jgi:hypothetical protein
MTEDSFDDPRRSNRRLLDRQAVRPEVTPDRDPCAAMSAADALRALQAAADRIKPADAANEGPA